MLQSPRSESRNPSRGTVSSLPASVSEDCCGKTGEALSRTRNHAGIGERSARTRNNGNGSVTPYANFCLDMSSAVAARPLRRRQVHNGGQNCNRENAKRSREKWVPTRFHVGPFVGPCLWPVLKNLLLSIPEGSPAFCSAPAKLQTPRGPRAGRNEQTSV